MKESAMRHTNALAIRLTAAAAAASALALAACGKQNDPAATAAYQSAADIRAAVQAAADEAEQFTRAQANAVTDEACDMNLTAGVNASLTQDGELNATGIEVHTKNRFVELSGSARSASARDRAAAIAPQVDGAVPVENDLTLSGKV
jgi:osmotically-inducible protein OsmY